MPASTGAPQLICSTRPRREPSESHWAGSDGGGWGLSDYGEEGVIDSWTGCGLCDDVIGLLCEVM